ncbi:MAG: nitrilase-related carbon-nitrogen hydrolase [Marinilabiliaceae bacterium]
MKVTLCQTNIVTPSDLTSQLSPPSLSLLQSTLNQNLAQAADLIRSQPHSQLYVLPEMFSTGFVPTPSPAHASLGQQSLDWLITMARQTQAHIAASILFAHQDSFRNRFVLAHPDGSISIADKRHLFTMGGEAKSYTPGAQRLIVSIHGLRLLLLVCYDLRFPVWSRCNTHTTSNHIPSSQNSQPLADYDAIIYVANWPKQRIDVWDTLLRARAIENQAFVIAVNRVGQAGKLSYNGHSQILNPWGREIIFCPDNSHIALSATLNPAEVHEARLRFPVLNDADPFQLL